MKLVRSLKDTAEVSSVLSAVVGKWLFSSSRPTRRGFGLGFKILWITLHISRDLLDDSAFSINAFRADLIADFKLFLTSRKAAHTPSLASIL